MAVSQNFRSALGGFHREDVVHYIEYMNGKHTSEVNRLTAETEELRGQLAKAAAMIDHTEELEQTRSTLEETYRKNEQLEQENKALQEAFLRVQSELETLRQTQAEESKMKATAMELEAYRRAEQVERNAKIRAEQIYRQAVGTLAQATTQVDTAANHFQTIAQQVNAQMAQLQSAVDSGRSALQEAAATMYTIRPEEKMQ